MARKKKELDNLTKDVINAAAAGLSYGQYKARQDRLPPAPVEGLKACKRCGKLFKPRTTQVYCDSNCQYLARLDAKRKKD